MDYYAFLGILHDFIREYAIYYFAAIGLLLILILYKVMKIKYGKRYEINRLKRLMTKNHEQALEKLEKSDLEIIDCFLDKDFLASSDYLKVKQYFSQADKVRVVYEKIKLITDHENKDKLKVAISIFSKLATPQAIDYLITFLYQEDPEIVKLALKHLAQHKSEKVIETMIFFLDYVKDSNILNYLKDIFIEMGPEVIKKLLPYLKNADLVIKIWSVDILCQFQMDEIQEILLQMLASDNSELKINVMQNILNYHANDKILDQIIESLENKNWAVRSQAAKTLGELQLIKAAPKLAERLTDKSGVVRYSAAEALLNMGYQGMKYLFEIAKKPDAPKEVIDLLKEQKISFLIESLEHIYQDDLKEIVNK